MHANRLLLFNIRTDADDHILGFTTRWINALAEHFGAIDVITMHRGRLAVSDNVRVYSVGREDGAGSAQRIVNFYRHLNRLTAAHRYDAAFAHMMPLFAVMGAPILQARGINITTWYTHRQLNWQVRWAERFSWRIVSAVPDSFPIQTPKLRAIGHGIDTDFFTPDHSTAADAPPTVVYVARLTEIKNQHVLIEAVRKLPVKLVLIGDIPDGYSDDYKKHLHRMVSENGQADQVEFAGALLPDDLRTRYQRATCAVNLAPVGLFDKAALESMACAVPTITCNPAFDSLTTPHTDTLRITSPDAVDELRGKITQLITLSAGEQQQIGTLLRENVIAQHSLKRLIPRLVRVLLTGEPNEI